MMPDWKALGAPLNQPVTADRFLFLTETGAKATPDFFLPDCFKNHGNYIISLGNVVRWMAQQAEGLGAIAPPEAGGGPAGVTYTKLHCCAGWRAWKRARGPGGVPDRPGTLGPLAPSYWYRSACAGSSFEAWRDG